MVWTNKVTLYTLGKKAALFCYVLVRAIENVAAATEIKKICTALCTVQYGLLVQVHENIYHDISSQTIFFIPQMNNSSMSILHKNIIIHLRHNNVQESMEKCRR